MADIYGSHFEYGGISSRQYSLIIANADTSRMTALGGSKEGVTIFSRNAKKRYLIDDDYTNSPISFDIEIVTENGRRLETVERRQIEKWLFNHRTYHARRNMLKLYNELFDGYKVTKKYEHIKGGKDGDLLQADKWHNLRWSGYAV